MSGKVPKHDTGKKSIEELYKNYYQKLFGYGYRFCGDKELVKDSIQEVFLQLWQKKHLLPNITSPLPYLQSILRRIIIDKKSKSIQLLDLKDADLSIEQSYEDLLINLQTDQEMKVRLQKCISALPDRQREVLALRFLQNMDYADIAEHTQTSRRTVYNQLHTAIKQIRKSMLALVFSFLFF